RDSLVNDAAQKALERFDETMRELALRRYREFERELGPILTRFAVAETVRRFKDGGALSWPQGFDEANQIDQLGRQLEPAFGPWRAKHPALEDGTKINKEVARHLKRIGAVKDVVGALELKEPPLAMLWSQASELLGAERKTFAGQVHQATNDQRM